MKNTVASLVLGSALSLAGCGGAYEGPTDDQVERAVNSKRSTLSYRFTNVDQIKCKQYKGESQLYTCTYQIIAGNGSARKMTSCFKASGLSWEFSGIGRTCIHFTNPRY